MWRICLVLVALVSAGCGRADAGADRGSDTPGSTQPHDTRSESRGAAATGATSEQDDVEAAIQASLDGFFISTVTVNDPPDPEHPDLERYRTGPVLENAVASVRQNQQLGIAYRRPAGSKSSHRATFVTTTADEAVVRDCVVDDVLQVAMADGRVLNGSTATKLFETKLALVDGRWKVSESSLLERWEGIGGCVF